MIDVPRDRSMRPLITPPEGGKPVPYTRCTTYVSCLEDTTNITKWKQRMTAVGLAKRPDLLMAVQALDPDADKSALNEHCESAMQAAGSSAKANIGTALHKFTEAYDRGEDRTSVPIEAQPDVQAYADCMTAAKVTVDQIECFVVLDELKIGGTFDRTVTHKGRRYILDVKTGRLDYGMGKIAMQLAVYAHARHYDPLTFTRTDLNVDMERAIVAELPAGTGKCFLRWVDIASGWEAVQLASQVRAWRSQEKRLSEVFEAANVPAVDALDDLIANAPDVDTLTALWASNAHSWTAAHTEAARARKTTFTAN